MSERAVPGESESESVVLLYRHVGTDSALSWWSKLTLRLTLGLTTERPRGRLHERGWDCYSLGQVVVVCIFAHRSEV